MPAESTNLIATSAGIEAEVVNFKRLHAEWAFGQIITAGIHYVHNDLHSKLYFQLKTQNTLVVQNFSLSRSSFLLVLNDVVVVLSVEFVAREQTVHTKLRV